MKRIGILGLIALLSVAIWYVFIKEYDYQITFKVKGSPASVYHQILNWESWGNTKTKNINTIDTILYKEIRQHITLQDTTLTLNWTLESHNDSITNIKAGITSEKHAIVNRLAILTGETPFTKSLKKELKNFGEGANSFTNNFKIKIEGESEIPALEYLYISSESRRMAKAGMMLRSNADLYPQLKANKVEEDGFPFVKLTAWDMSSDVIKFDFGFPIKYKDSLPINSKIKYGKTPSQKALKATFYGNYRYSDQAWFALLEYANRRNISIVGNPLEIFYNNPMQDGNASQWKAEIYLPIK
ncbi:GyrI-like domain-containing protein [Aquimarina sp. 2201CG14-23]|uniref:GyrI-like domain-containing protein n=1 Tax=Aquimarina mycalae TaxID=3040073 RepID=UPI002477E95A|nr:GyrI-like domain-containing protein [Aquimarina sp. 2201CG14-23]MDH7447927.1 GyrI-like domain-containing protein [Aquimarina sp. 2201CG14-23]